MRVWLPILLLLVLAELFYLWAQAKSRKSGLPKGKVVYADNDQWQTVPAPLYDPELKLTGKPDYVVALKDGAQVPVEIKSGLAPKEPYETHMMQLAAYCCLIERTSRVRPPYGLLHYDDKTFQVEYTPELEGQLLTLVADIRKVEAFKDAPTRSHNQASRCRGCGYLGVCEERL